MNLLKKKAISFLITFISLLVFLLIYTFLLYKGKISSSSQAIFRTTLIIGAIFYFIYGLLTGIIEKKNGFISSILSTLVLIIVTIVIKVISKSTNFPIDIIKYVIYILASGLGGIIGVNLFNKKKLKRT